MRPTASILITSLVLAVSVGCQLPDRARSTRTETRTLELKPGGQLRAQTFNGSIRVEGWERDEVSLVAEIRERREGDIRFVAESRDGRVEIIADQENRRNIVIGFGVANGVSYTLKVPKTTMTTLVSSNGSLEIRQIDSEVDATTSNARITADEVGGKARLTTSNGSIRANTIKGEVIARTSNASLEVRGVQGGAELRTSNGRLEARDIKGRVEVTTSNGSIIAENIEGDLTGRSTNGRIDIQRVSGGIDMTTSNGSIKADGINGDGRGIRLTTTNASIDVTLGQAEGMLEARTSDHHSVRIEIPNIQPTLEGKITRAKIGNGTQPIELKTTNGRIIVR